MAFPFFLAAACLARLPTVLAMNGHRWMDDGRKGRECWIARITRTLDFNDLKYWPKAQTRPEDTKEMEDTPKGQTLKAANTGAT
jgi:hypothetical protein